MALENRATLDGILKEVYAPYIRDQVSTYSPVQEMFEKITDADWEGRQVREAAIMSYNEGVGATTEDGNLPTAGNFDPQQFVIPMKYLNATFKMTKQMMESAKTSKGAFKNATRVSFDTVIRNLKRERARMLWGSGTGVLALVNGDPGTGTTLTVDSPGGIAGSVGGARFLRKGMMIGFVNPTGPALRTGGARVITAVAADGNSVTVDAAIDGAVADNDYVVRANIASVTSLGDTGTNNEPMGLTGLIDDGTLVGTYFGLSRTTYPQLKARLDAAVGPLSLDVIQKNIDYVEQQHDSQIDGFCCHHAVRRAYLALLEADRRYTGADLRSPDGGTKVVKRSAYITYGGLPIVEDKFAPYDQLFGYQKSNFRRYVQKEGEWADDDGAILNRENGKDNWTAFYRIWENYFCDRPGAQFYLTGITTNKLYVPMY